MTHPTTNIYRTDSSVEDFCQYHDLHPHFLAVPGRKRDEWELLREVVNTVRDCPDLQQSIKETNVVDLSPGNPVGLPRAYLWTAGSYPVEPEITERRWANPSYTHGHEHQNHAADRDTHLEKAMNLPSIRLPDIADRFGITDDAIYKYVFRNEINFEERHIAATERIGRSIRTTARWERTDCYRYVDLFPAPNKTVENWVYDRAADFEPPAIPENARWA